MHSRLSAIYLLLWLAPLLAWADDDASEVAWTDSADVPSLLIEPQPVPAQGLLTYEQTEIDMRLFEWALSWIDTTQCMSELDTVRPGESIYRERLSTMPCVIQMPYNSLVQTYIELYIYRRPRQLATLQRMSERYFPIFENKLAEYGLPNELKYLAVIESALNAQARSHAGAAGLWQFMPATGKLYGLEINSLVDERLDPYKSTDAACRFLRSLHNLFGDWNLAIAAYNCGPGNVNKAISRSGGKRDFWEIFPYLPRETRSYVPIFIAANYAMTYSDAHGICPDTIFDGVRAKQRDNYMPLLTDTIMTTKRQHLMQTADVLGINLGELRRLNPQYQKDVLPGGKPYSLVLPLDMTAAYIQYEDSILAYKADSIFSPQAAANLVASAAVSSDLYYKVKKGDTLGAIAKRYGCSVKQLQQWNNLHTTNLQIGQRLRVRK